MKIKLVGKNLNDILPLLQGSFFEIVDSSPELIIAHGGDGTLLNSEREYPNIPKLPLRDIRTATVCPQHTYKQQLNKFCSGKTKLSKLPKLKGCINNHSVFGINDIFIHNCERGSAMRYQVWIDSELYANEIVGDAVGVSTVHGSTAYYKSITHSIFRTGIGLAFSNSTEVVNHLVLPNSAKIEIKIVRGPALLLADNSPNPIEVAPGDSVTIEQSNLITQVYGLEDFMCPICRILRHPSKLSPGIQESLKSSKKQ